MVFQIWAGKRYIFLTLGLTEQLVLALLRSADAKQLRLRERSEMMRLRHHYHFIWSYTVQTFKRESIIWTVGFAYPLFPEVTTSVPECHVNSM
jgi:hypothetical protein